MDRRVECCGCSCDRLTFYSSISARLEAPPLTFVQLTLATYSKTLHVVPVTTNVDRAWMTDLRLENIGLTYASAAQCHLCTVIDREQIVEHLHLNIGAIQLAQARSIVADLLDLP